MPVRLVRVSSGELHRYARVPIRFTVSSRLRIDLVEGGLGGLRLVEEPVDPPYEKDYDTSPDDIDRPPQWPQRFDTSQWAFWLAEDAAGEPTGAATVAYRTPDVNMLEGRDDLAVLWDLRVDPDRRGEGIGTALFRRSVEWAIEQGCIQLKVETQNTSVAACRFYAAMGCELGAIHRYAYAAQPEVAHEAMLLWYVNLPHQILYGGNR
jgi:GNAT superfamily N-acetyltransferase